MNTVARIAKNYVSILVAQLINIVLNIVILGIIARYLGTEGYGQYFYIYAFILIFETASDLGLRSIIIREIAQNRSKAAEYLGDSIILKVFTSALTMAFIVIFAQYQIDENLRLAFYYAGLAAITQISTDFFSWLFRGFEKMEYETALSILNRVILFGPILVGIRFKAVLNYFFLIMLIANIIRMIVSSIIASLKFFSPKFRFYYAALKSMLLQSAPLGISMMLMISSRRINIFLLNHFRTESEVGLFSSAFVIFSALVFIPTTFTSAAFPVFSKFAATSKDSFERSYEMSFKYLFILSVPIVVGLYMLSKKLVLLVFGDAFLDAYEPLQIMSLSLGLRFLNFLLRFILISIKKQNLEFISVFVSLFFTILFGFYYIPKWGCMGAAYSLLIAELIVFIIKFFIISKKVKLVSINQSIIKPSISAIIMGVVLYFTANITIFVTIPLGAIVYTLALFALGEFGSDELILFKKALRWQS